MRVLITGANGFIGKNLVVRLGELDSALVFRAYRNTPRDSLSTMLKTADVVVHLAGENRPAEADAFKSGNFELTDWLCAEVKKSGRARVFILASSIQADAMNEYGASKRQAELAVKRLCADTSVAGTIFRLSNVFGKWCKPNYNSVVATFCHNIARDMPVRIDNAGASLRLIYIDDVVSAILREFAAPSTSLKYVSVMPEYSLTVGELASQLSAFKSSRQNLLSERVGRGLTRALYATYVSYLPTSKFAYDLPRHVDPRGEFVEMLKTPDCGQFSFFTARPGVTRGGHYHHSKTEKFLVLRGSARFKFRNIVTNEKHEILASGKTSAIIETVPGWTHDITNIGDDDLIVMLWANEIFDALLPDTITCKV